MNSVDDRITENMLRWYDHVMRMNNEGTMKKIFVSKCTGTRCVGRLRKRRIYAGSESVADARSECVAERGRRGI